MEWCWQGTEWLGAKPVPIRFGPPQIPHGLVWNWTQSCAVRDCRQPPYLVDPMTAVKLWGYALQSAGSKSLYWQTLYTDVHISETCLIDHIWLCRKYSSFLLNLLFINIQGCAVKMGLCKGEDHSTARLVAEFVLFEETFAPSAWYRNTVHKDWIWWYVGMCTQRLLI